jgi:hypothetical protein
MARGKSGSVLDPVEAKAKIFGLVFVRGYPQSEAVRQTGLTSGRVSQIVSESREEWLARAAEIATPETLVARKLTQLQDIRAEAWMAWERSKKDAECNTDEKNLKTVYRTTVIEGKKVRLPVGERLRLVKSIKRVEGRLPANEYLVTILRCLQEEARLEGLTEEMVVHITQNNIGQQNNVSVDWGALSRRPHVSDEVEVKIAAAKLSAPSPPNPLDPSESGPDWTEAEARELDDESNGDGHLNGDSPADS